MDRRKVSRGRSQASIMEPEVIPRCKRTVVSTLAVQPGTFHHLSALDRAMESNSVRAVYYYPQFPSVSACSSPGSITGRLRDSLSDVLNSYPAATGRLQRAPEGHWVVKCNDAGVRMVEARARGNVQEWLQKVDREREMKLIFWEDMYERSYFWSTFYVQLTEFERGGLAIGVSCSHMLADAACLTMVVKAWADMSLLGKMLSPPDFRPLPSKRTGNMSGNHPPYLDMIDHHYKSAAEIGNSGASLDVQQRFNTATFAFSDESVRSIIDDSRAAPDGPAPTAFQALAALYWASISRVKGRREGLVDMSICVDARETLNLSKSFFGNATVFNAVLRGAETEEGIRLDSAAKAIANVMSKLDKEGVIMGLIECLEDTGPPRRMFCGPRLLCANWEGLRPYVATFEPGVRPIHVSYYLEPVVGEGQVLVLPIARGHEGSLSRVVMATLPEDQLAMLCDDVGGILRYHPEILMGPHGTHV